MRGAASIFRKEVTEVTYYVALPFVAADDGIAVGEARVRQSECGGDAGRTLSRKAGHIGAIAFSRSGDPATGDYGDTKVIRKFGDVPDDLSVL
jgi:hypothetical protein